MSTRRSLKQIMSIHRAPRTRQVVIITLSLVLLAGLVYSYIMYRRSQRQQATTFTHGTVVQVAGNVVVVRMVGQDGVSSADDTSRTLTIGPETEIRAPLADGSFALADASVVRQIGVQLVLDEVTSNGSIERLVKAHVLYAPSSAVSQ